MIDVIKFIETIATNIRFAQSYEGTKKKFLSKLKSSLNCLRGQNVTLKSFKLCRDHLIVKFSNDHIIKIRLKDSSTCWHYDQFPVLQEFENLSIFNESLSKIEDLNISLFIQDVGAKWIADMLTFMYNLESLSLVHNKIYSYGISHILSL